MRHRVFQVVSAAIVLGGLVAAFVLCRRLVIREESELQRNTETEAQHLGTQLQARFVEKTDALLGLGKWWITQGKPFDKEDWRNDGQLFLSRSKALLETIWISPDGRQQLWSAVPGADPNPRRMEPDDRVRQVVEVSHIGHAMALSDVFSGPGNRTVVYVSLPVTRDRRIRGYIVGLYDATLLMEALSANTVRPDHRISISASGRMVYSNASRGMLPLSESARASFVIANKVWEVAIHSGSLYLNEFRGLIVVVASVFGALIYSLGMLLFISHRRSEELERANEEVEELNRQLRRRVADFEALLDVTPIGIAVADDAECRTIRVNRSLAKMLGVPASANISKSAEGERQPYRILHDGREVRPEELPMQVAGATGMPVLGEEDQIVREDGHTFDVLSFASPLFDENGRVRGVLNACVDITERKTQERLQRELGHRLQRAQRMKSLGVMAAGIAHGFNNLLTGIIGQASLALEDLPHDPNEAARHMAESMEAARHAAALIHQVLAYTGQSYHTLRAMDLGEVVRGLQLPSVRPGADGPPIRVQIASGLPQVMADAEEVRQALNNLVQNALEATQSNGGTIEISVQTVELSGKETDLVLAHDDFKPGVYVQIVVRDTGPGMPAETVERAFDPFYSTKFLGRGLGLAEVLGIMRAHNGAVRLRSAQDRGTTVELFFSARDTGTPARSSLQPMSAALK